MNHYKNYSAEDFVQDLRFRSWVTTPSTEEDLIWQRWIAENPHMREVIALARAIVLSIHPVNTDSITDKEVQYEVERILAGIDIADDSDDAAPEKIKSAFPQWLKVAASIALAALTGWYVVSLAYKKMNADAGSRAFLATNYMIERINKSDDTLLINLPDSSSVLLSQNSLIRYPTLFAGTTRTVFLQGSAFFEVTKNPKRPFYVNAGPIVAKVLGTSFEVSTDPAANEVRVIVKSGKVSIYSSREQALDATDSQPNIILTEHEQLVLKDNATQVQHTRLHSLGIDALNVPDTYLKFIGTPVAEVFASLAKVYGVKINFQDAELKDCSVTASFTDEPFALKLHLICRSIGLSYEMANDEVTITGNGCNH